MTGYFEVSLDVIIIQVVNASRSQDATVRGQHAHLRAKGIWADSTDQHNPKSTAALEVYGKLFS
jgi:hypothetical protein